MSYIRSLTKALYTPVDHVAQRVERPYIDGR